MQSKRLSLLESVTIAAVGFCVSLAAQLVIFPAYGIHVNLRSSLEIVCWFTVVSVVWTYAVRRLYNHFFPHPATLTYDYDRGLLQVSGKPDVYIEPPSGVWYIQAPYFIADVMVRRAEYPSLAAALRRLSPGKR